jgi:hypothetical protein
MMPCATRCSCGSRGGRSIASQTDQRAPRPSRVRSAETRHLAGRVVGDCRVYRVRGRRNEAELLTRDDTCGIWPNAAAGARP